MAPCVCASLLSHPCLLLPSTRPPTSLTHTHGQTAHAILPFKPACLPAMPVSPVCSSVRLCVCASLCVRTSRPCTHLSVALSLSVCVCVGLSRLVMWCVCCFQSLDDDCVFTFFHPRLRICLCVHVYVCACARVCLSAPPATDG